MSEEKNSRNRQFPAFFEKGISLICVGTAIFYLYTAWAGRYPLYLQIGIIFGVCMALCFLYNPPIKGKVSLKSGLFVMDCILALMSVAIAAYLAYDQLTLPLGTDPPMPTTFEYYIGAALMLLVLEGTRRVAGWPLIILIIAVFLYCRFGDYLPKALNTWNFPLTHIIRYAGLDESGIYGVALRVAAGMLIPFFILSSFLKVGGAGKFFIELPTALVGRFRGGSAKIAVVASSLFGTVSGSATANVVTTGTFTIPLMKSSGYTPEVAGAIEALASTGGQIMPPIMGIAAFVMAELLNMSYWSIVAAAFLPAVTYYVAIFVVVRLKAAKENLPVIPKGQLPSAWKIFRGGWYLLIPLAVLVIFLGVLRWTPERSCLYAIITLVIITAFKRETAFTPKKLWTGLNEAIRGLVVVIVFCASIGLIIGMVGLSGFGPQLSGLLIDISQGRLIILLLLTMICSLILGMGMSTTPCYLFLALLIAPALVRMEVPPLAAHLFVFYFGVISTITPPVALAAYAASPIAGADPMKIGWNAVRMGLVAYIMPYFFVLNPAFIMQGTPLEIFLAAITAIIGAVCFGVTIEGYFLSQANWIERSVWLTAGLFFLSHSLAASLFAIVLIAIAVAVQLSKRGMFLLPIRLVRKNRTERGRCL